MPKSRIVRLRPMVKRKCFHEGNPRPADKLGNSPFARLLERRGRLGLCASCGRLGRFGEPAGAEQVQAPVIARLHPVPTQPVFCPREESLQLAASKPSVQERVKEQGSASSAKKSQPKTPLHEEIPAPPVVSDEAKPRTEIPRQLDVPREPTSWIFTSPEKKSTPVIESQLPPRPSEPGTRL